MNHAERSALHKQQGLCVDCDAPALPGRVRCAAHLEYHRVMMRKYAAEHIARGLCVECSQPVEEERKGRRRCKACLTRQRLGAPPRRRAYRDRMRDAAYHAYGGYVCACCGEQERLFLTLDHVAGGGAEHRRQLMADKTARRVGQPQYGYNVGYLYRWLRDHKYPPGLLQVLCYNCNAGRWRNGGVCPHRSAESASRQVTTK